jgi:hypothetical protein
VARRVIAGLEAVARLTAAPVPAAAQGHGAVYGLSTPTLGRGGWSLDIAGMGRVVRGETALMSRVMLAYGITEDLQLSVALPMPLRVPQGLARCARRPACP